MNILRRFYEVSIILNILLFFKISEIVLNNKILTFEFIINLMICLVLSINFRISLNKLGYDKQIQILSFLFFLLFEVKNIMQFFYWKHIMILTIIMNYMTLPIGIVGVLMLYTHIKKKKKPSDRFGLYG